ncbi:ABC transporter permease [Acidiferrimicrobium sp. IK]|uniref:ABC transporter permease n=1 Tax=Acidiferrimicrobium sp. IK TaxID=2871700 RepID=UPI0021CB673B|nr:ABC transporter permease [Acidiferrimicrobium sp. IK]MCU4183066.1 ABC transporter permease [Acidiferrimicrobium sp. IK]
MTAPAPPFGITGGDAPASRTGRVRPATFLDAVRAETTKLRSVRSTWITLLIATVLSIGISALVSALTANHYASASPVDKATFDPTSISLAGFGLGQLAIAILAILFITSEYSSGMIRTSLAAVPKRGRLLGAKVVVYTAVALVLGEVLAFISFLVGQVLLEGQAPHVTLGDHDVLRAVIATGLYLAVLSIISIGFGTIVRSTAGAISLLVAVLFVLPGVAHALPTSWERAVTKYWPTEAGRQVTSVVPTDHVLGPWAGFADMCVFAVIVMVVAAVVLQRRDA